MPPTSGPPSHWQITFTSALVLAIAGNLVRKLIGLGQPAQTAERITLTLLQVIVNNPPEQLATQA